MPTVLVVDDEPKIAQLARDYLEHAGFSVLLAGDGTSAVQAANVREPDLVVPDLGLPGIDGLEVMRRIRATGSSIPIVVLTARDTELDKLLGLELGADDYVTKPFSPRELVLRVEALLRRVGEQSRPETGSVTDGDLVVDSARHEVTLDGSPLSLTSREFDLLRFLVSNPGTAYSRDELLQHVWGWSFGDQSTVTVHVRRLREKVEADPTHPVRLATVWGVGYRWEPST